MIKFFINVSRILFFIIFMLLVSRGAMVIWLGIFGVIIILALLLGRAFCDWICPMNTIMTWQNSFQKT